MISKLNQWKITGLLLGFILMIGCAYTPGGIAPSTTPIDGRSYTVLGRVAGTDSRIKLFGILPISGSNSTRQAIDSALRRAGADAMIDVVVEGYSQYWILFTRDVTRVEGMAIKFD